MILLIVGLNCYMKKLVIVILSLQLIGVFILISHGNPIILLMWMLTFIPSVILARIATDPAFISYKKKYENNLEELKKEKEAYEDARHALEHTGLLLGELLIEKKEIF